MTTTRTRTSRRPVAAPKAWWREDRRVAFAGVLVVLVIAVVVAVLVLGRGGDDDNPSSASAGFTGGDFHSLVADPAVPERLFVGGHQAVSVSDDGGVSWRRLDALDDVDAMGWGFASGDIWISGHPGIVMSPDGGETADRRNDALPDTDIHALGAGQGVIYAAGPNVGVIASRDGGATWQSITTSDGQSFFGRILVDPDDPQRLIAADAARGPVASDDGGATWDLLTTFPVSWVSAADGLQTIYASSADGAVMSGDAGASWEPFNLPSGASLVEVDQLRPDRVYAGVHDGADVTLFVSDDQGSSWSQVSG